jgi:hypothetical protein
VAPIEIDRTTATASKAAEPMRRRGAMRSRRVLKRADPGDEV